MCDFQYLPLQKKEGMDSVFDDLVGFQFFFCFSEEFFYLVFILCSVVRRHFLQALRLIPNDLPSALSWWETCSGSDDTPLFLPPYQFSR